jgi:4-hydroxythreonine-4-phosphate dehydrogenase
MMKSFVFTCGDINGIGPEVAIKTLNKLSKRRSKNNYYFLCPINIFEHTAKKISPEFSYEIFNDIVKTASSNVKIINIGNVRQNLGKPTIASGKISYKSLQTAFRMLQSKVADGVITAPISKTAIKMANIKFAGHTEMLANWCNTENYVMTFLSKQICIALCTIHYPLKKVSNLLDKKNLENIFKVLDYTLRFDLNISNPKIAVLGLNPHSGENGLIGKEEKEIISPAIKTCSRELLIEGPFPSDAFFARKLYQEFDIVVGMYHDQALIPFKLLNPKGGVNYTAGLPIVRTSPDHGVAYDIAGNYVADESSMIEAFSYAEKIINNRKKQIDN